MNAQRIGRFLLPLVGILLVGLVWLFTSQLSKDLPSLWQAW